MSLWLCAGIVLLTGIIVLYRRGKKDAYKEPPQGTQILYEEAEESDFLDEFSPENIDFDKALKNSQLRTKLQNIEMERDEFCSAPFVPMSVDDYLLIRRMKGSDV